MLTPHTKELVEAFGYLYEEEAELLQKWAELIPDNGVCVNIGAGAGTSAIAVLEKRPDLTKTFYTIDISLGGTPLGSLEGERNAFDKAKMPYPNQIHADSKDVGREWQLGNVDFLIIDGDHSAEGARGDINSWTSHLEEGAVVFVHDYNKDNWIDVVEAVDDLMFGDKRYKFLDRAKTYIAFVYIGEQEE